MKKALFFVSTMIALPSLASSDCDSAYGILSPTLPLVIQAAKLNKANADYKTIAEWRVKTFNPQIDQIIEDHKLTPKDMMNPELEITRTVYNEVTMRSKIYVNQAYAYSKGNLEQKAVDEQRLIIGDAIQLYKAKCETN